MAALSTANSIPAKLESLFGTVVNNGTVPAGAEVAPTLPVKGFFKSVATVTVPGVTALTGGVNVGTVNTTVTGVALGDAVIAVAPTTVITNCSQVSAFVSAADTVTLEFYTTSAATISTISKVVNLIVADLT